jgi:hypothetical protein
MRHCTCHEAADWHSLPTELNERGADDLSAETVRGGRRGAGSGRVEAHDLCPEGKYGGMDVSQAQEAKQLRNENTKLRKMVADLSLDKEALQSVIRKNGCARLVGCTGG